jgi:hypothetical protein
VWDLLVMLYQRSRGWLLLVAFIVTNWTDDSLQFYYFR